MKSETIPNYINNSKNQENLQLSHYWNFGIWNPKLNCSYKIQCVYLQVVMLNPVAM